MASVVHAHGRTAEGAPPCAGHRLCQPRVAVQHRWKNPCSAKTLDEMHRIIFNDYVDATLAALFVMVVVAVAIYGVTSIRKALGNPQVTAVEVGSAGAMPEASHA
jgi:hypothetical protein